jgi:hypothetical protein
MIGQTISTWKVENQSQERIQLPLKKVSAGVYVAKLQTTNGTLKKNNYSLTSDQTKENYSFFLSDYSVICKSFFKIQ